MKVLVTGGSGFIGSHLTEALLNDGQQVRVFDRRIPSSSDVEWTDGDLRWIGDCDRATRDIDTVFHLAARISVDESIGYALQYFNDNLLTTVNVMHAALKNGVRKFVYTSTCEVYGDTSTRNADETYGCNPTSPYAASKYAAERAVLAFGRTYDLQVVIMRPFNTFGERQKPFIGGAVIPSFILLAHRNKDLIIHGDGSQTRDYNYVKDVADAHVCAMKSNLEGQSILNIATGVGRSISGLAEQILQLTESKSKMKFVDDPRKGAQLKRSVGDSHKLRSLGWQSKWDYKEALSKTINWYKSGASHYQIP